MRGQILRELADEALRNLRVQRSAQVAEHARRRDHDDRPELVGMAHAVQRRRDVRRELLFGALVLIGLVDRGLRDAVGAGLAAGPVGAELARRQILVLHAAFDHELEVRGRAAITQEQRLAAVAHDDQCIIWNVHARTVV